jgi:hypothetical protein
LSPTFSRYPISKFQLPTSNISFLISLLVITVKMTAVLPAMQGLSLDGGIMPPSPVSQNSSRHGRSRHGGSVIKGRGRGYSIVDEREVMISKALTWVLKRTVKEDDEQEEGEDKLVADGEGWVDCEEVVSPSSSFQCLAI